jgi:hypothetical protein
MKDLGYAMYLLDKRSEVTKINRDEYRELEYTLISGYAAEPELEIGGIYSG